METTAEDTECSVPSEGKAPPKYAWLGAGGLASAAFGTGVSTQGGASYVPQIARDLQSAPVIPPGAFPNGMGDGETYTATISAAEIASSDTTAEQVFAEAEASRQAAQRQGAEAACVADPEACSFDPAPWEFRLSPDVAMLISEAIDFAEWAYTLGGGGVAEQLITFFKEYAKIDIIKEIDEQIRGAIEHAVFGDNLEEVTKWVFEFGDALGLCGELEAHRKNGFCMVTIQTVERRRNIADPGWVTPNFSDEALVRGCVPTDKKVPNCDSNVNDY